MGKIYHKKATDSYDLQIWPVEDQKKLADMIKLKIQSPHVKSRFLDWLTVLLSRDGMHTETYKKKMRLKALKQPRDKDNRLWVPYHGAPKAA